MALSRFALLCFLGVFVFANAVQARDEISALQLMAIEKAKWLNVEKPLTADDFNGRAVLLDFWTYGCINCMQIIPDLEFLEQKYSNKLLIIGVHSAKFAGEQGNARILSAAKRFGLKHPVYNDSDFMIWKSFQVKAWPTQILLGPDGQEIARYQGEGHRADIDSDLAKIAKNIKDFAPAALAANADKSVLSFPSRIMVAGNAIYIADTGHNRIVEIDLNGKILQAIGSGTRGDQDGDLKTAQFNSPHGMVVSGDKLFIADTGNHKLRLVDLQTGQVSTLAGNGKRGKTGELASPWDVEMMNGNLVVANAGTHQILAYELNTRKLSVLAGSGREDIIDGPAKEAALAQPSGLSFTDGILFFVDVESSSLRELKDGKVTTLIGTGLFDFGLKDGQYPDAQLQHEQGLFATVDKIYLADTYNNAIRVYDLKTKILSTLKLLQKLNEPGDIKISGNTVYIADTNNNRIVKIDLQTGQILPFAIK